MSSAEKNNAKFRFQFLWVPKSLGGHSHEPWEGMRPNIRWQGHIEEYLTDARGVSVTDIEYDAATSQGIAFASLIANVPDKWLKEGELIELLDGYRVLAIGKIIP